VIPGDGDARPENPKAQSGKNQTKQKSQNRMTIIMKNETMKLAAMLLLPSALLALTSCSSTPSNPAVETNSAASYQPGVPGGTRVDTYQTRATVTAIDRPNRRVTVVSPNGATANLKIGPDVVNFNQIEIGDQVKATVTRELVVSMANQATPDDGAAAMVALAPVGARPGGVVAGTVQITARVVAINLKQHQATLQLPDGTKKIIDVRKDVDLTHRQVGEEVVIRTTESVAILVEKP
jgi:hypothetical protein